MKNIWNKERGTNLRISEELFGPFKQRHFVPRYTSHIEDAWKVVTQMRVLGWLITIHAAKTPGDGDDLWTVEFNNENPVINTRRYMDSNTDLQLAICELSLNVLDGEKRINHENNL